MCRILLSINPTHVNNIINGDKTVEYRRIRCKKDIDSIVIYETAPTKKVIGEVEVKEIIQDDIINVWNRTKTMGCVSYEFYRKYYKGKEQAVAYVLGDLKLFDKPQNLKDFGINYPPQSYMYI